MDEKQRSKLGFAVAAFKSNTDRFNSSSTNCGHDGQHIFQEYTYKKITPCDVCREILRGHTRQGLKCKMCRVNVHSGDCQLRAAKCQPKSGLLRRQKSASEIESRPVYGHDLDAASDGPDAGSIDQQSIQSGHHHQHVHHIQSSNPSLSTISSNDPVYDMLRKAVDARAPTIKSVPTTADRSWTQVMGQMGILPPHMGPLSSSSSGRPPGRSSASSSASNSSASSHLLAVLNSSALQNSSSSAPHSPQRRQKLNLRMKSFSLDESTQQNYSSSRTSSAPMTSTLEEQQAKIVRGSLDNNTLTGYHSMATNDVQRSGYSSHHSSPYHSMAIMNSCISQVTAMDTPHLVPSTSSGMSSPLQSQLSQLVPSASGGVPTTMPTTGSSTTINRRPIKGIRMSSVELPSDTNDKSSASPSPCPSPKPQRLLPTNLYVVLYNFRSRHEDELDLKAGATVTVTDTSDLDWWQGKCYGHVGYFPSKYVAKLHPGERPLQMVHTIQVSDGSGDGSIIKLLRDQIVIQVGDEMDSMVRVRTGMTERTVPVPVQYVQEV